MKQIRNVLFDLDGTLTDSISTILESFHETFTQFNMRYPGDEVLAAGIGSDLSSLFSSSFPNDLLQTTINTYRDIYLKKQREGKIKLFPDVRNCLISLSQGNKRMAVVTTKRRTAAEELLQGLQIDHFFEGVVGSEDVQNCKPNPEPILLAMRKLNVSFADSVYVGDSVHDAQAAKAANVFFVGVLTGSGKEDQLKKYGPVFSCLSQATRLFL
jgi:phosphoglycolate phosphatase-like HAD superfamily hydrolase